MALRKEVEELDNLSERNESPLDPAVYEEPNNDSSLSILSSSLKSPETAPTIFPFTLPRLEGDKPTRIDRSCSLLNIWSILFKAAVESFVFGCLLVLPAFIAYMTTESSWYNFFTRRWDKMDKLFISPVMEFVRYAFLTAVLYSLWVLTDAVTRIIPLIIRRSWHLLNMPLPNAVKMTLSGWKAARKSISLALFGLIGLVLTDLIVFGSSKLVSDASDLTYSTLAGFSKATQYIEKILITAVSLSVLVLGKKILMQFITTSYRKQALAPRIISSNFKFRALTRLYRQTNLGDIDARRSIVREQAREALHPADEDFIEISKDMAGIRLTSQQRADAIARALWPRVCPFAREYLVLEDFRPFFTTEDAPEAFAVFDLNSTGIVNEATWIAAVIEIWNERRNLQSSVKMSDAALVNLESIIMGFICTIWGMSVLGCISPGGYAFLSGLGGVIFGFGFLFKDTCERIFKSFIFVLVEHPFDIGDMIIIDKTHYDVLEMQLFQTTFKRISDSAVTYIPNNTLLTKYIYNEQRSGLTTESLLVTLPSNISISVLGSLQSRLGVFLSENFSTFTGKIKISPIEVFEGKMNIRIEFKFQDYSNLEKEVKIARKNTLSDQIQAYLQEHSISV